MRVLLLFSLLSVSSFSQTDTVQVVRYKNYFPWLGGVQNGEIPYALLCDTSGITIREKGRILSFHIQYVGRDAEMDVAITGNTIPDSICIDIGRFGLGNMIFLTQIMAVIENGTEVVQLNSMNLIPIKREE